MTIQKIDVGNYVECDFCSKQYTGKPDVGGLLFGSKGACPECAPRLEQDAEKYGETEHIKARCPEGMSFAAWIVWLRDGNNTITIRTGDDALDMFRPRRRP